MSRIKFKLIKFEKCLVFQVLEQDPTITCDNEFGRTVYASAETESRIITKLCPELGTKHIFIRGSDKAKDRRLSIKAFINNHYRDAYFDEAMDLFKKWSGENNI